MTGALFGDRVVWQRQAATKLRTILDAHRNLPVLSWTISPDGALVARVGGHSDARAVFDTWRDALMLIPDRERVSGGAVCLAARTSRGGVPVHLVATVVPDLDTEPAS